MSAHSIVGHVAVAMLAGVLWPLAAAAQADIALDPHGGGGGGAFNSRCPDGKVLAGVEISAGDDIDSVRALCATPLGRDAVDHPVPFTDSFGGSGGSPRGSFICPEAMPVVTGLRVESEGEDTTIVNGISMYCGKIDRVQPDAPRIGERFVAPRLGSGADDNHASSGDVMCPAGMVAVGIDGRSGAWLDAVGLICGAPMITVGSIGKLAAGTPPPSRPGGWTICDRARDARARHSPAAPNLEAQCRASPAPEVQPSRAPLQSRAAAMRARDPSSVAPVVATNAAAASRHAARDAMFDSIVQGIATAGREPHAGDPDRADAHAQDGTIPGERVTGNRLDRYPADPTQGRHRVAAVNRGGIATALQPGHSIRIVVQYPVAYGYREAGSGPRPAPNSCGAFFISVRPGSGMRLDAPVRIDMQPQMRSVNGRYACEYLAMELPFDAPLQVRVAMSDQRAAGSAIWLGGSQPRPPAGQRREIADGDRQLTLTANAPSAALRFDMTYAGLP